MNEWYHNGVREQKDGTYGIMAGDSLDLCGRDTVLHLSGMALKPTYTFLNASDYDREPDRLPQFTEDWNEETGEYALTVKHNGEVRFLH